MNFLQLRKATTKINNAQIKLGIRKSQRSKYPEPHWLRTSYVLRGNDVPSQDVYTIRLALIPFGFVLSEKSIQSSLDKMIHVRTGIHPHIRAIGKECKATVLGLGGVKTKTNPVTGVTEYYFNKPQEAVIQLKKQYNVTIPKK